MDTKNKFYILGCQRTGTTLLELILESHPDVYCFGELCGYSAFLYPQSIVTPEPCIGFDIPGMTENFTVAHSRGLYDPSRDKILFTSRDPVDVVASMAQLPHPLGTFLNNFIAPIIQNRLITDIEFCYKYAKEMEFMVSFLWPSPEYVIAAGALYYKNMNNMSDRYRELGYSVYDVEYADLVTYPEINLVNICEYLGLPWSDNLLNHHLCIHTEVLEENMALGNNPTNVPIFTSSINKGYTQMSKSEINIIKHMMSL